jgi:hypothetical protein
MYQLLRKAVPALALIALALPASADAQLRAIVSKNVSASSSGATLELEFSDDGTLRIALEDGDVLVDGDAVASYAPGDALEVEWRSLLGQAKARRPKPVSESTRRWRRRYGIRTRGSRRTRVRSPCRSASRARWSSCW